METYDKFINNILNTRGRFACGDEYYERHHIIPRCMNGTNDKDNLIDLYPKEHYIAHKLLVKENPGNKKLVYAWWMMSHCYNDDTKRYKLSPDEYEEAKISFNETWTDYARKERSDKYKGSNNPNFGNHSLSGKNHPMAKQVIRLLDRKIFDTVSDAATEFGINVNNMRKRCKKRNEYMYYDEFVLLSEDEIEMIINTNWKEEARKNIIKSNKKRIGENNSKSIYVYCPELDKVFYGCSQAHREMGVDTSKVSMCINGKRKHAGKHPVTGEPLSWVKLENK